MDNTERDAIIGKLLNEGTSLSDIQKVLENEHDCRMTYMDLRLIASDLQVNWEKIDGPKKAPEDELDPEEASEVVKEATLEPETTVTVSKIVRPGAVVSGEVTFKSGKRAEWFLDAMGRLGLNPLDDSGNPDEDDIADFQVKLQEVLKQG